LACFYHSRPSPLYHTGVRSPSHCCQPRSRDEVHRSHLARMTTGAGRGERGSVSASLHFPCQLRPSLLKTRLQPYNRSVSSGLHHSSPLLHREHQRRTARLQVVTQSPACIVGVFLAPKLTSHSAAVLQVLQTRSYVIGHTSATSTATCAEDSQDTSYRQAGCVSASSCRTYITPSCGSRDVVQA
jgi:hypothetical protein